MDAPHTPATLALFLPCPKGVETLLLQELQALGGTALKETPGGVHASGDLRFAYRACLHSRLASRVLLPLAKFTVEGPDDVYAAAKAMDWQAHFGLQHRFAINVAGRSRHLSHSQYAALKFKDGVVDAFRAATGARPSVDAENPDIQLHLHIDEHAAQFSLDLSGPPLHQRGYRLAQVEAPLKETLAAALLIRAGWPQRAEAGEAFFDPFCGSGTLVIEAAWMAAGIAAGHMRPRWGFSAWKQHDRALWQSLLDEALAHKAEALKTLPPLFGRDNSAQAIAIARGNGQRAGLTGKVDFVQANAEAIVRPVDGPGLLLCNPPYGERLSRTEELIPLHRALGSAVKAALPGWRFALFTGDPELGFELGLRAGKQYSFFNGAIPCKLLVMDVHAPKADGDGVVPAARAEQPTGEFANRLQKNLAHLGKWARRNGVQHYRLYDADLPQYAVAVDVYQTEARHAVVQEYAAPSSVDPVLAQKRLREVLQQTRLVLDIPRERIHLKQRRAQKGSSQYQRQADEARYHLVQEHGVKLWVNFTDYLDTGLFLDHRPLRQRIQQEAAGKRFLNLFCYTGSATAHAAVGGAASTVSVDLSNTYLHWLDQNLEANDCNTGWVEGRAPLSSRRPQHALVRADILDWLGMHPEGSVAFDLIFCDPPTFSNSKKMEDTWDVQRDHLALLQQTGALLSPTGVLYFSCNRQRFKLDQAGLEAEGYAVQDITAQTLGEDFARPPPAHRAWRITRSTA